MPATVRRNLANAFLVLLTIVVLLGLFVACSGTSLPGEAPTVTGTVREIDLAEDGTGTLIVDGPRMPPGAANDRARIALSDKTQYFDDSATPLSEPPEITTGMNVRVWLMTPPAESHAVQGTASVVQVLD